MATPTEARAKTPPPRPPQSPSTAHPAALTATGAAADPEAALPSAASPDDAAATAHAPPPPAAAADGAAPGAPDAEQRPWGPTHPCYPHANPHAPAGSATARATRVIRVARDWMAADGDACPAFARTYPAVLAPWVREPDFRALVADVNAACRAAFAPAGSRAWGDLLLGAATGWLSEDLGWHGAKRGMARVEAVVAAWNLERRREFYASGGWREGGGETGEGEEGPVRAIDLRRTAFMSLDLVIPDPKLAVVGPDAGPPAAGAEGEERTAEGQTAQGDQHGAEERAR